MSSAIMPQNDRACVYAFAHHQFSLDLPAQLSWRSKNLPAARRVLTIDFANV
jgi:hypothetical protein